MKKLLLTTGLAVVLLTACSDSDNLYNPNWNDELGVAVPENFDWSTTQSLNINVNVKDEYNGKYNYLVAVFTQQPTDGVFPVSVGVARKGVPYMGSITIPATVEKLYVTQTLRHADGTKSSSSAEIPVKGTQIDYTFTEGVKLADEQNSIQKAVTRGKEEEVPTWDEALDELEDEGQTTRTIETNTTISEGIATGEKIIVKNGAVLTFTAEAGKKINNGALLIEAGSQVNCEGDFTPGSHFLFLNNGVFNISGTLDFSNGATIYNNGCITADHVYFNKTGNSNGGSVNNNIIMYQDAYIGCRLMEMGNNNTKVVMNRGSWIKISEQLKVKGRADYVEGDMDVVDIDYTPFNGLTILDSKYSSLIQVKEIYLAGTGSTKFTVKSPILVEYQSIRKDKDKANCNIECSTSDASNLINISGTACSGTTITDTFDWGNYTYAMEDMYPERGDYDMNDIVMEIHPTGESVNGYLTELTLNCKLRAVGAAKTIAAYVNLTGISTSEIVEGNNPVELVSDAHAFWEVQQEHR